MVDPKLVFGFAAFAMAVFGLVIWRIFSPVAKPERPTCTDSDYCHAFRSATCKDGRCRHHCRMYCECEGPRQSRYAMPPPPVKKPDQKWN